MWFAAVTTAIVATVSTDAEQASQTLALLPLHYQLIIWQRSQCAVAGSPSINIKEINDKIVPYVQSWTDLLNVQNETTLTRPAFDLSY